MKKTWKNFVEKWNNSLQKDKQIHFLIGIIVGSSVLLTYFIGTWGYLVSILSIQLVGYGIEFYQSTTKDRHVESLDAYAVVAGGALTLTVIMIFMEIV